MKRYAALIAAGLVLAACKGSAGSQGPQGETGTTGGQGLVGPQGPTGPQGPVGPKGLHWTGGWSGALTYDLDEVVEFGGSSWIAVARSTADAPPSVAWALFASRGDQGPTGSAGLQGVQGLQGPQGLPGAAGPKGLSWRGPWTAVVTYAVDDAVEYGGASYVAVAASTADAPPSGSWVLLAAQGGTGPQGPAGVVAASGPFSYDSSSQTLTGIPADATHAGFVTTAAQTFAGAKYGPAFIGKDVLGCADVRAFGAVGDGVADDTAAIQAAIDSFTGRGGVVCLPPGLYKLSDTLIVRSHITLRGSGHMDSIDVLSSATVLDGRGLGVKPGIKVPDAGADGITIEDLAVYGPEAPGPLDFVATNATSWGIQLDGSHGAIIHNVRVHYFYGAISIGARGGVVDTFRLDHVFVGAPEYYGVYVAGAWSGTILDSHLANAGQTDLSRYGTGVPGANLVITKRGDGQRSTDITVYDTVIDESFGSAMAASVPGATVKILGADRVHLTATTILLNGLGNPGDGYGIMLGDGTDNPTKVRLVGMTVAPFAGDRVPAYCIILRGSGHALYDVTTVPNGGGDIRDLTSDATWVNVNGKFKLPLPGANPGPGSKQLWYDPDDGNRVKFAP